MAFATWPRDFSPSFATAKKGLGLAQATFLIRADLFL